MLYKVIDLFENKLLRGMYSLSNHRMGGATHKMDMAIRWVHVAELTPQTEELARSVKAGDLLIIMGPVLKNNPQHLMDILKLSADVGLSAIILYDGALEQPVPQDIIRYADECGFPLLQIKGENPAITDLMSTILNSIAEYNYMTPDFLPQHILMDIINSDFYSSMDIFLLRAESLGFELSVPHQAVWVSAAKKQGRSARRGKQAPGEPEISKKDMMGCADRVLNRYYEKKYLKAALPDACVFLVPSTYVPIKTVAQQILTACMALDKQDALCFRVGIGSLYGEVREFTDSLREAREVVEIMEILGLENNIRHVDDVTLSMLVKSGRDDPMFRKLYTNNLQPLLEMDVAEKYDLVGTLKTYFDCGKNVRSAAEQLYVHRNTMKSRLEKIEELTSRDLKDPLDCLELSLALHHYKINVEQDGR